MRKLTMVILALGLAGGLVAGCGTPNEQSVATKLETQVKGLDASNYHSTAMMTVQMDNSSQAYYVETWYESPTVYKIALGDANKQIHQIIVHNDNGMFIVSPSLGKVFRFNGNWAQNQGHIYLYNELLQQIVAGKDVKMNKTGNTYSFQLPVAPSSDVVSTEQIDLDATTFRPQQVTLLDKNAKAVVTLKFLSFATGMKFTQDDFNPQAMISSSQNAKTTMAESGGDQANTGESFAYVDPTQVMGDKLEQMVYADNEDVVLRYVGTHDFTLDEWRPNAGVDGIPNASLVDLLGVPGIYSGSGQAHQLTWINNGVEFALTSNNLSMDQMQAIAMSTFGQVGK